MFAEYLNQSGVSAVKGPELDSCSVAWRNEFCVSEHEHQDYASKLDQLRQYNGGLGCCSGFCSGT